MKRTRLAAKFPTSRKLVFVTLLYSTKAAGIIPVDHCDMPTDSHFWEHRFSRIQLLGSMNGKFPQMNLLIRTKLIEVFTNKAISAEELFKSPTDEEVQKISEMTVGYHNKCGVQREFDPSDQVESAIENRSRQAAERDVITTDRLRRLLNAQQLSAAAIVARHTQLIGAILEMQVPELDRSVRMYEGLTPNATVEMRRSVKEQLVHDIDLVLQNPEYADITRIWLQIGKALSMALNSEQVTVASKDWLAAVRKAILVDRPPTGDELEEKLLPDRIAAESSLEQAYLHALEEEKLPLEPRYVKALRDDLTRNLGL